MRFAIAATAMLCAYAAPASSAVLASGTFQPDTFGAVDIRTTHAIQAGETWRYTLSWEGLDEVLGSALNRPGAVRLSYLSGDRVVIVTSLIDQGCGQTGCSQQFETNSLSFTLGAPDNFGTISGDPTDCANREENGALYCARYLLGAAADVRIFGRARAGGTWQLTGELLTVPEPETWAMLIAGFSFIGAVVRRRRANPLGCAAA